MVGIGGAGMAAIAHILLEMGVKVSGSDLQENSATQQLAAAGAKVYIGHKAEQIGTAEVVVVSTAIAPDNPEVLSAQAAGIAVWHRSQMLAEIMNRRYGIAVAGAHGKTTTTSLLAWVLHHAGRNPTFLIGGEVVGLGGAQYGTGQEVVAEADESDRSFLRYQPAVAVVTGIEADHLEHYHGDFNYLVDTFAQFLKNIKPQGTAVLYRGDPHLRRIGDALERRVIWYGDAEESEYVYSNVRSQGFNTHFTVLERGQALADFSLSIPGRHNILNALAVIAVCRGLGMDSREIQPHLATFKGARRRFEVIADVDGVLIVDDYAHHPSEVSAAIAGARAGWPKRRVIAVFQPHRYTRTHFLMDDFARCFAAAHHVVLTDVYSPPPDEYIQGATGERLAELTRKYSHHLPVDYIPARQDIAAHLKEICQPGDIVLTMGAGDIWRTSRELAGLLRA
ncbi:MAG TPA: UDP-N-acetylmuramate--L-alanine ligase [Firmicutes bacterium]|jgi:UDP-N-acetylmuramate--alanine ligase|nr:UDP-N-acetylmuramate--L-alanine ligase [Bacillota bacterium]